MLGSYKRDHGLYNPNIKNADSKSMFEIAKEITENTQRLTTS